MELDLQINGKFYIIMSTVLSVLLDVVLYIHHCVSILH